MIELVARCSVWNTRAVQMRTSAVVSSREAIWALLANEKTFTGLQS